MAWGRAVSYEEYEGIASEFTAGRIGRRQFMELVLAAGLGLAGAVAVANSLAPAFAAPPRGDIYGDVYGDRRGRDNRRPRPRAAL